MTAGIYASRLGLDCIVLEKGTAGGMLREAPWIENFPGFGELSGNELAERMKKHASQYVSIHEGEEVLEIQKNERFRIKSTKGEYETRAVLLATGCEKRKLGVQGEKEFLGKGVSYCATCDGFLFRGKRVAVVGGGNSAALEALYLKNLGCRVCLIHRRHQLRAEKYLQDKLTGIELKLNRKVERILGDGKVRGLELVETDTGNRETLEVDGVFIAIGEVPNNHLARQLGLELSKEGWIKVDGNQRTSLPRVYAAGDVTGLIRQIVVACAQGAVAAISAFEDLKSPYWKR